MTMKIRVSSLRLRRSVEGALLSVLMLGLPACTLDRSAILTLGFVYECTALVRDGAGNAVPVSCGDMLLGGGAPYVLSVEDAPIAGELPRDRALAQWSRYLRRRLEDPSASPEFRARFGNGPHCLLSIDVRRTDTTAAITPTEAGAPLADCGLPPLPAACGNPPGVTPHIEVAPPLVDFGPVPVGIGSTDLVVMLSNSGAGRLCLGAPALDPAMSPHLADFALDATDCAPRSSEEIAAGYAFLEAARPACSLRLRLTPAAAGVRQATLRASSGDLLRPVVSVPLQGDGLPGMLRASPNPLCLNTPPVMVGGRVCHRNNLALINDGPGRVNVTSIALPADAAADWALGGFMPGRPGTPGFEAGVDLTPGASLTFQVRECEGTATGTTLAVASNAASPVLNVPFQSYATGCTP
jgi:hypothetical protein